MTCRQSAPNSHSAARIVSLCLILGLAATLLSAWTPPFLSQFSTTALTRRYSAKEWARATLITRELGGTAFSEPFVEHAWGIERRTTFVAGAEGEETTARESAGWPMLAFTQTARLRDHLIVNDIQGGMLSSALRVSVPNPAGGTMQTLDNKLLAIPVQPKWPGVVVNTASYGAAFWLFAFAPLAVRRRMRRHRGLCERCAYDRRGRPSAVPCPECGHEVPT